MMHMPGAATIAAADGGQQNNAASGLGIKSDTSENVVVGFSFNALSTIFVMLMASCAKLAGEQPRNSHFWCSCSAVAVTWCDGPADERLPS